MFSIDGETRLILQGICDNEGIDASELLRLLIRAWRMTEVCHEIFPFLTTWKKAQFTAQFVRKEIEEIKSLPKGKAT